MRARNYSRLGVLIAAILLIPGVPAGLAQTYSFGTLAGNAGYGSADGPAAAARFFFPQGLALDAAGNLYVADTENSTIRRVDPTGSVSTMAGAAGNVGSRDDTGSKARFSLPQGVAVDTSGNIYVADTGNSIIRKLSPAGTVVTIAGLAGSAGSANGTNAVARFRLPAGIAVDSSGIVYVADTYNNTIRMVTPSDTNWIVTTLAGVAGVIGNADGTNSDATFFQASGIALDANGNLFIADTGNNSIRKIVAAGTNRVTKTIALFNSPRNVAVDAAGTLYVADSTGNTVRERALAETNWTILAGFPGVTGSEDGAGLFAQFDYPNGIAVATNGFLYVADSLNNTIRKVTSGGSVSTFAGLAGGAGDADGSQTSARFDAPMGMATGPDSNIYLADSGNNTIRLIGAGGVVTTLAGVATNLAGSVDGPGTNASFNAPAAVAVDANTNIYVADLGNNQIRKITPAGGLWMVSTVAGRAGSVFYGAITNYTGTITNEVNGSNYISAAFSGGSDFVNYSGIITNISGKTTNLVVVITNTPTYTNVFNHVTNIVTLAANAFTLQPFSVSTNFNRASAFINYAGFITNGGVASVIVTNVPFLTNVISGKTYTNWLTANAFILPPAPPLLDGVGANALFHQPSGIVLDAAGDLYVADGGTNGVRIVTPDGTVTTLASAAGAYAVSPAQFGTNQLFYHSSSVAFDGAGNLYVADAENNTIRTIAPGGAVTTIAGSPGLYGVADGTNATALFGSPVSITIDAQTNLFVADAANNTIRKLVLTPAGWVVTTIGGAAGSSGSVDGLGADARFNHPGGVAVDLSGNLYVSDTDNSTIRVGHVVAASPPPLHILGAGGQMILSWPATAVGFTLEVSSNPGNAGSWTPAPGVPVVTGGQWVVTNGAAGAASFYRLRSP